MTQSISDFKKEEKTGTNPNVHQQESRHMHMIEHNSTIKRNKLLFPVGMPNIVDKSQKHAEWKKPETEEYILYDSIYRKFEGGQNSSTVIESGSAVAWGWGWEEETEFKGSRKDLFGMMELLP